MTRASAFVLGYHGCDKAVGEKILAGGEHLKPSDNDYDWLGTASIFGKTVGGGRSTGRNLQRSIQNSLATQDRDPFVVGAIVDLGNCLDLLEAESIRTVERG